MTGKQSYDDTGRRCVVPQFYFKICNEPDPQPSLALLRMTICDVFCVCNESAGFYVDITS